MTVLDCGHKPTETTGLGTGVAHFDGKTMCYDCAAKELRNGAEATGKFVAYVSTDGHSVITWDGQVIGRVISRTVSGYKAYYSVTAYGKSWYGQGPSESGTYVSLRLYKNQ